MTTEKVSKHQLLIVDDNPNSIDILLDYLSEVDLEITVAEDGERALELSQNDPPDLILVDVLLPGMDGFETCRHLKANNRTKDIPVIFMTSLVGIEDKLKGFEVGGVDYVTKPIEQREMLSRVKVHLTLRHMQKELRAQNAQLQQEITERQRAEQTLMTERNLLRTLIDNLPDQIYVKNRESQFMLINPAVMHDLGVSVPDEAIGKTDFDFHPPELAAQYYADEQAILQSGQPLVNKDESNVDHETGGRTWVLATKVPLYNSQGKVVGLVGIGRDITERRKAEEALRQARAELEQRVEARTLELRQANEQLTEEIEERKRVELALRQSEERYRNLVESAPDVVYTLSTEATFTSLNPAFERITGWSQTEWQGRSYAPLLHPEDLPLALTLHDQVMQGKTPPIFELRVLTRKGGYIVGEFTTTPLWHEEAVVGVLGIARDITRRKRAEEEIQRRNRELALLNQVIAASVTETELEAILEIVCRELALAFDVPQAGATLVNEKKTEARVVAEYLTPGRPSGLDDIIPVEGNPSYQYLLNHKTPLVLDDAQNDPRLATVKNLVRRRGTRSLLLIPFLIEGEVVGSLGLDAIERRSFSTEEVSLAWSVAKQVSGVLARLRLDQERRRLEAQYYQAQKMEAIGRLTGGVAHDFNNILTVIMGYCGFILDDLGQNHPLRQDVEQVQKAAERATSLTRQLLAFSRQEILRPRVLNLNDIVINIEKMLQRLIGEDVDLVTMLEPQLGRVKADPGQLEQVIMNLVVNARDVMPQGGKLTIETANIYLDEEYARQHVDVVAGPYIMLAVSDTGLGMDAETQARIFEPFFTTKELGQGTGLGLATVHGIVHQSGGHIWVYSELGHGTIFKIYLPQIEAMAEVIKPEPISVTSRRGTETILLVEDEAMVREFAQRALVGQGYNVLEARDGVEAYDVCIAYEGPIHLLLTDVVIPGGMSGPQLAKKLILLHPELKVLYMSGYTGNAIVHHGVLDPGIAFLQKPFVLADLIRKVREVLDLEDQ